MARKKNIQNMCEYNEIRLKAYALSKNTVLRKLQLAALFILIKNKYKGADYYLDTTAGEIAIPEEFDNAEVMALSKVFETKSWHVFIDEEHYVDIDFEFVMINGEIEMFEYVKGNIMKVEKYKTDINTYVFQFNKYSDWLWGQYLENQYKICIEMGNRYLRFGSFYVYDNEYDEFAVVTQEDFDTIKQKQYILLKSKLDEYKGIFIDISKKMVIAIGLDALEREYLEDMLNPSKEGTPEPKI